MRVIPLYFLCVLSGVGLERLTDVSRQPEPLPFPLPAEMDDLSGVYLVQGRQGTKTYAGACVVTRLGSTYLFTWTAAGNPKSTSGIGFRDGDRVQVGWGTATSKGVTSYRLLGGGVLAGRWCALSEGGTDGGIHTETLTLLRRLPQEE